MISLSFAAGSPSPFIVALFFVAFPDKKYQALGYRSEHTGQGKIDLEDSERIASED
jgi:hypothetical protein